jgi:UDP-N-acetylmuramyl pentapeptide phosphotransferase/UDP-N-acetylglucosamine-1-phosphate transferase
VRGGGIIFPVSVFLQEIYLGFPHPYFTAGLLVVSGISFVDDIKSLPNRIRLLVHFFAAGLMFLDLGLVGAPWWVLILTAILLTGFLNAFNFMDGINGITGAYGLVSLITFTYINEFIHPFIDSELALFALLGIVVFNYFNFRIKARCFAGDVGSISLAFIIGFLLLELFLSLGAKSPALILLVGVYGVDSVLTIIKRVSRGENIFMAHRSHIYQILVHKKRMGHLQVSVWYGLVQLILNVIVIFILDFNTTQQILISAGILIILSIIYWIIGREQ